MFGTSAKARQDAHEFDAILSNAAGHASGVNQSEGIIAGTRIATEMGWRPVEGIVAGDRVMTFDHGPRPVVAVKRMQLWLGSNSCPRHLQPLAVPVGALGNATAMLLLPEQTVLVESDMAEAVFGDPFALIPAAALEGYRGIDRITPHQKVEVVVLEFDRDEVIYANGTGMIHCNSVDAGSLSALVEPTPATYEALPLEMARSIVAEMIDAEMLYGDSPYTYAAE
jgi:hypothetical protein